MRHLGLLFGVFSAWALVNCGEDHAPPPPDPNFGFGGEDAGGDDESGGAGGKKAGSGGKSSPGGRSASGGRPASGGRGSGGRPTSGGSGSGGDPDAGDGSVDASDGSVDASDGSLDANDGSAEPIRIASVDLVSVTGESAVQGNKASASACAASEDGRYVVFASDAANLVPEDSGKFTDVFLRDRVQKTTIRISEIRVTLDGGTNDDAGDADASGPIVEITEGDAASGNPSISADGRYIVYDTAATNLAPGHFSNRHDVLLYDRESRATTRISTSTGGTNVGNAPRGAITADGQYVVFDSLTDLDTADQNGLQDVYLWTREGETVRRISVPAPGGTPAATQLGRLSSDGLFVTWWTAASAQLRDLGTGTTTIASRGEGGVAVAAKSSDVASGGRFVAFDSDVKNVVPLDTNAATDVFLLDRRGNTTTRVSLSPAGTEGDGASSEPRISADGRFVVFSSAAKNFSANEKAHVMLYDRLVDSTQVLSKSADGALGDATSNRPWISASGRWVCYSSAATNLVATDANAAADAFLVELE